MLPSGFTPTYIKASVNGQLATIDTSNEQNQLNLRIPFSEDEALEQNAIVTFKQSNSLFKSGNITEILIPTLLSSKSTDYKVTVNLPPELQNSLSISKPMFTSRTKNSLTWNGPTIHTIQLIFGSEQYYQLELAYELTNNSLGSAYVDIPLPPDTVHQRIFQRSISEKPDLVRNDKDGNHLARYSLKPKEKKRIIYRGDAIISIKPNEQILKFQSKTFSKQDHLLTPYNGELSQPPSFDSVKGIYTYVINTLSYDYSQLNNASRTNAKNITEILKHPTESVCLDYSTLFVSLARTSGIPAREMIGFGFSQQEAFRPVSGDLLHTWAEYFNKQKNRWISVDPTWEDTSRVDYFSSFDLNHVVLAIHGEKSHKPFPAGFYRFHESKGKNLISIRPSAKRPIEHKKLLIRNLTKTGDQSEEFITFKFEVENQGNTTRYDLPIKASLGDLALDLPKSTLDSLLPGEKSMITVPIAKDIFKDNGNEQLILEVDGVASMQKAVQVPSGYTLTFLLAFLLLLSFGSFILLFKYIKSKKKRKNSK